MKLNEWQWLVLVLSVLWAVITWNSVRNDGVLTADHQAAWAYKVCTDSKMLAHQTDLSSCDAEKKNMQDTFLKDNDQNAALAALAPLPFFWLAAFIAFYVWRILVAGCREVLPWRTMARFKKAVTVFSGLAVAAMAVMVAVSWMSMYVETKVPVQLALKAMVINTGDAVTAEGTWISTTINPDDALVPLQTSQISCYKPERRCTEARASLSNTLLIAEVVDYDLASWTDSSIVLRRDLPCAQEVYTIDLQTNVVSAAGKRVNDDDPFCKTRSVTSHEWTYRLADGFPQYWKMRQEARPWALKMFAALFGN